MKIGMRIENHESWLFRLPTWLTLGLTGLITMLLAQWAPPEVDVVLVTVGGLMMVSAVFCAWVWVGHLLRARRLRSDTRQSSHRHPDSREGTLRVPRDHYSEGSKNLRLD